MPVVGQRCGRATPGRTAVKPRSLPRIHFLQYQFQVWQPTTAATGLERGFPFRHGSAEPGSPGLLLLSSATTPGRGLLAGLTIRFVPFVPKEWVVRPYAGARKSKGLARGSVGVFTMQGER